MYVLLKKIRILHHIIRIRIPTFILIEKQCVQQINHAIGQAVGQSIIQSLNQSIPVILGSLSCRVRSTDTPRHTQPSPGGRSPRYRLGLKHTR